MGYLSRYAVRLLVVLGLVGALAGPAIGQGTDEDRDGFATAEGDCDDTDGSVFPGAAEMAADGLDSNCDGRDFPRLVAKDAQIYRLYAAYFLREPDASGWAFWRSSSMTLDEMSAFFAASTEFKTTYGALTDGQFIDLVYDNVLGRAPEASGRSFWVNEMASGRRARGEVMTGFSEGDEFSTRTGTEPIHGSERPTALPDAELVAVEGCGSRGSTASISGSVYEASISCRLQGDDSDSSEYLLNRDYSTLTMSLGQRDDSASDQVVRFLVSVDGRQVLSRDVAYGQAVPVSVDVRGVLRLRVEAVNVSTSPTNAYAVFGRPIALRE